MDSVEMNLLKTLSLDSDSPENVSE